jgi:competence protein ComEA
MNSPWLDRHRHLIFVILLIITFAGAALFYFRQPTQEPLEILPAVAPATVSPAVPPSSPTPSLVRVFVSGAVINSDVYFLPQGSIVKDAILAAGGFAPGADSERINQALELKDQQQLHVPRIGEENLQPLIQGGTGERNSSVISIPDNEIAGLININTATPDQLDSLPGIGPAIAQRIVEYRESIGGFNSIDQITEVKGIGPALFDEIKGLITVQ